MGYTNITIEIIFTLKEGTMKKKIVFPLFLAVLLVIQIGLPMGSFATGGDMTPQAPSMKAAAQPAAGVTIGEQFADPILAQHIASHYKVTVNDVLTQEQINQMSFLVIPSMGITSLQGIEIFHNLTTLSASYNNITRWPDVSNFPNLKVLYLNSNPNLCGFPIEVTQLKHLEYLSLNLTNAGCMIPPEIGNMTTLKSLNLANSNVLNMPDTIGNLVNLEELYYYGNQLTEIPDSILKLKNLRLISFGSNHINTLSVEVFNHINGIQKLRLEYQHMENTWKIPAYVNQDYSLKELYQVQTGWLEGIYPGVTAPMGILMTAEEYQKYLNDQPYDSFSVTMEKNNEGEYYIPGTMLTEPGEYVFFMWVPSEMMDNGVKTEFANSRVASYFTVEEKVTPPDTTPGEPEVTPPEADNTTKPAASTKGEPGEKITKKGQVVQTGDDSNKGFLVLALLISGVAAVTIGYGMRKNRQI